MHRLSVKHSLSVAALSSAVFLSSIGFLASKHILLNSEDLLELEGYGYNFNGAPFSGIAFDMYENWRPKHLQIFWKGKFLATEYLWYHDGQQMAERPHKDGLPHGQWKMWYPDGSVKSLRTYEDGQLTGEMWGWHANGQVSDFNLYDKGQEISHKSWVSDGTPYYNYVYYQGKKVGMKGGEFCKPLQKRSRK